MFIFLFSDITTADVCVVVFVKSSCLVCVIDYFVRVCENGFEPGLFSSSS